MSASTGRRRSADIHDRYELGIGELVIDLRDTDLPAGDVPINVDLGMGEARVLVPEDVCVATSADIGMGNVAFFGRDNGGVDVDFDERPNADGDATRLLVDADVGVGELRVDDDVFFHDFRRKRLRRRRARPRRGGNEACATTGESASG